MVSIDLIKQLRDQTGVSLALCREALKTAEGNIERALRALRERGAEIQQAKASREAKEGIVDAYVHSNGKIGALVALKCETDFVARSEEFRALAHDIAMQIAASGDVLVENDFDTLLGQPYIKNPSITLGERFQETVAKFKENIQLVHFTCYRI